MMKFESILDRVRVRKLSQLQAAEILGMSERTFRRWRDRHEAEGLEGLRRCAGALARGCGMLIFPEGTRSTTGELGRFRSGVGRLAAGKPIPIVPAHLSGAARAWPKGSALPRPRALSLRIGEPLEYGDLQQDRGSVRRICTELHDAVAELGRRSEEEERSD